MDFAQMSNKALRKALKAARKRGSELFALDAPTVADVDEAEALVASIGLMEAETDTRAQVVTDAEARFAAARAAFSNEGGAEASADAGVGAEDEPEEDPDEDPDEAVASEDGGVEAGVEASEDEPVEASAEGTEASADAGAPATVAASGARAQRITPRRTSAAQRIGERTTRPNPTSQATAPTVITAAADVPGFGSGQVMQGMDDVAKAMTKRARGFPAFNAAAAQRVQDGGVSEKLARFDTAQFSVELPASLTASKPADDYAAVKAALEQDRFTLLDHTGKVLAASSFQPPAALSAAGWCAPSETIYSFIADYVVDGLWSVPEVSAPRGGLNLTTGPARSTQGAALDSFGFVQTEAQAEAGTVKTCETIDCPDFTDHRLDAIGHCIKIPLLTQHAYPELITDSLRLASVLYAHKVNRRVINDLVSLSSALPSQALGGTFHDTLEALSVTATRRRRKWNVGENHVMEVKLPTIAREVFRSDMSRRTGLALSDVANDARIAAEFAARGLAVEYGSDWQEEVVDANAALFPAAIQALIYPKGTFIKALENVINLQTVYDAASLSINEYTGVFFEQGILVAKAGYGSDLLTIPVCVAGQTGAAGIYCEGGSI